MFTLVCLASGPVNAICVFCLLGLLLTLFYKAIDYGEDWTFETVMIGFVLLLGIIMFINIADITWILGG